MSLQYIIDGCNLINHHRFISHTTKRLRPPKVALLESLSQDRLCGSPRNKITVVFDGYRDRSFENRDSDIHVVFSENVTADQKIKKLIEGSANPKNIIVVTDDKEIKLFARLFKCKAMGVAEFIPEKAKMDKSEKEPLKAELTYSQRQKINEEFRRLWLKEG